MVVLNDVFLKLPYVKRTFLCIIMHERKSYLLVQCTYLINKVYGCILCLPFYLELWTLHTSMNLEFFQLSYK